MTDLERLKELKQRIEFLRESISEAELIHSVEQTLTEFCEFQCTFHKFNKKWEYYIRCYIKYENIILVKWNTNKLESLYYNIKVLVTGEY
jgi:hypothetical protein